MNKRFIPVISDTVLVPVKGSTKDAKGQPVPFKFSLVCNRISASTLRSRVSGDFDMKEILREVTTDWQGQRLITDQENGGQPAEFCAEAFDALLDIAGMALVCFGAYTKETSANEKN